MQGRRQTPQIPSPYPSGHLWNRDAPLSFTVFLIYCGGVLWSCLFIYFVYLSDRYVNYAAYLKHLTYSFRFQSTGLIFLAAMQ